MRSQVVAAACELPPSLSDSARSCQRVFDTISSFCIGFSELLLYVLGEVFQGSLFSENLDTDTITLDLAGLEESLEIRVNNFGESELPGDENGLSAGELELRATEGLLREWHLFGGSADGDQDGSDVDTSGLEEGLSVSVTHTGLESISTGAGKHLVDADHMPSVYSNADMERLFRGVHLHVLVSSNTRSFESLGRNLLLLTADQMDAGGELFPLRLLHTTVIHPEFWVRDTTVEA